MFRDKHDVSFSQGQRFITNSATTALDSLLGLVACNSNLALLNFGRIVIRKDYADFTNVKIVSGGASGHDPAYGGYVGKGMLTAAIQGDILTSPPASEILKAIKEIMFKQQTTGMVIFIQNNTGDCFNFGLAVERVCSEGIGIKLIIVSDDVSQPNGRGLTGIILLQKIAGALSETDKTMEEIFSFCSKIQDEVFSVLISLKPCTTPTKPTCICVRHFHSDQIEIGSGLGGEGGAYKLEISSVEEVCALIIKELTQNNNKKLILESSVPIVVLVNNLGATSILEERLFQKELIQLFHKLDIKVLRFYCGHYMTVLDMAGFTVTVLRVVDPCILELLDAATDAPNWINPKNLELDPNQQVVIKCRVKDQKTQLVKGPKLNSSQSNLLLIVVQFAGDALLSCERQLNIIDGESGDGDTGTRLRCGIQAIFQALDKQTLNLINPFNFLIEISSLIELSIAGALGCIYSIFLESAANSFLKIPDTEIVNAKSWLLALESGNESLKHYLHFEKDKKTMFDPLCYCELASREALNKDLSIVEAFEAGLLAAEEAIRKTKKDGNKYPDPGAHAVGIWLRAIYEAIKLRCE